MYISMITFYIMLSEVHVFVCYLCLLLLLLLLWLLLLLLLLLLPLLLFLELLLLCGGGFCSTHNDNTDSIPRLACEPSSVTSL